MGIGEAATAWSHAPAGRLTHAAPLTGSDVPALLADVPLLAREVDRAFAGREVPPYEVFLPRGAASVDATKGVLLVMHGGGWLWNGKSTLQSMDPDIARWLERGFTAVNVDYHQFEQSRPDVTAFHDAVRAWAGPEALLGVLGGSAGGHLALMTAAERPDVEFAVSIAGPTDLLHLGGSKNADFVADLAKQSFGDHLLQQSPVAHAREVHADTLLVAARHDGVVPSDQVQRYLDAGPHHAQGMLLESGRHTFMHANVSAASFRRFVAAEDHLAQRAIAAHVGRIAPTS